MDEIQRRNGLDPAHAADTHMLRRILITAGLVVVVLILIAVAIYAGAFLILAPMMQ
jgi:hypothetical protein